MAEKGIPAAVLLHQFHIFFMFLPLLCAAENRGRALLLRPKVRRLCVSSIGFRIIALSGKPGRLIQLLYKQHKLRVKFV